MAMHHNSRPPLPPFTCETATQKVRLAEDAWNTRDPERVALAYTLESTWRNRSEFLVGRDAIVQFLRRKWAKELDYPFGQKTQTHYFRRVYEPTIARSLPCNPSCYKPTHRQ